jgi:peptide/bleomycin uptake transporter
MAEIATLGVVVQVANAFGEVRSSLAVIIDNWTRVTRVRSIWRRLHEFERNMDKCAVAEMQ